MFILRYFLAVNNIPIFCDNLHFAYGLRGVAEVGVNVNGGLRRQNGTHGRSVKGIVDSKISVLGGINPPLPHGFIEAFLCQSVRQKHGSACVCVAPCAVMVVLAVGGAHVPSGIQGFNILIVSPIA